MITNIIVFSAIGFAVALLVAWLIRPDLRAWIERPKYRFQANVQSYDHARSSGPKGDKSA
ncbi:MAG TPA: hypothetical protein VH157_00045 [Bryobacteraceae bacterium]|jgi:hypothetical protein|nr:hypothetical protein [Bryobacteraceae bacterium]